MKRLMMKKISHKIHFRPFLKGMGPEFRLILFNYPLTYDGTMSYKLDMNENDKWVELFSGHEYCPKSCLNNKNDLIEDIMSWLTLRPGDTDSDYFKDYTELQLEYCKKYAETLYAEVLDRFGDIDD